MHYAKFAPSGHISVLDVRMSFTISCNHKAVPTVGFVRTALFDYRLLASCSVAKLMRRLSSTTTAPACMQSKKRIEGVSICASVVGLKFEAVNGCARNWLLTRGQARSRQVVPSYTATMVPFCSAIDSETMQGDDLNINRNIT